MGSKAKQSRWATSGSEFCISGTTAHRDPPGGGVEGYPVEGHTTREVWGPKSRLAPASSPFYAPNPRIGQQQARRGPECPKWPKITQNGSGQSPGRVRTGSTGQPTDRVQRGAPSFATRQLPTANRQSPTASNRQPPATANRQPPSTSNHQPTTNNQVPVPWKGSNGPVWAILDLI